MIPAWGFRPHLRISGVQVLPDDFVIIVVHAQPRLVRHCDETVVNDFLRCADDHIIPPGDIHGMVFQDIEVLCGRCAVDTRVSGYRAFRHVHSHRNAVALRQVADLLRLERT